MLVLDVGKDEGLAVEAAEADVLDLVADVARASVVLPASRKAAARRTSLACACMDRTP